MKKTMLFTLLIFAVCLQAVVVLDLSHQGIRDVDDILSSYDLGDLQVLNLSGNEIASLGDVLKKCVHLKKLNLSDNKIRDLGDSLNMLSELETLDLAHNELETVAGLTQLFSLKELKLSGNKIGHLHNHLDNLQELTSLCVCHNELYTLGNSLKNLTQLEYLDVRNNYLSSILDPLIKQVAHMKNLRAFRAENQGPSWASPSTIKLLELHGLDC